jgi:hypothetical protein
MAIPLGLTGAARTRAIIEERRKVEQTESSGTGTGGNGGGSGGTGTNKTPTLSRDLRLSMSEMSKKIGNLAQTNYYHIQLTLPKSLEEHFKKSYSKDPALKNVQNFVSNRLGYLCSDATLPVSSYATAEVKDNFMGVPQEFAHTRLYTDIDLTFYVDSNYSVMRFFEGWMDYISGGNGSERKNKQGGIIDPQEPSIYDPGPIYKRFVYPDFYKAQTMSITKFERDFKRELKYTFVNAFPKALTAVPVSYGSAEILKVSVTFNFDRYFVGRVAASAEEKSEPAASEQSAPLKPQPQRPRALTERGRLILEGRSPLSDGARIGPRG